MKSGNKTPASIFSMALAIASFSAAQAPMPKTTTESIKSAPSVAKEQLHGTVLYVEGNTLVVRISTGDVREFQVPSARRFIIDGKELTVGELKAGTTLSATITTTTTPVMERTTTVGSGTVWFVNGNSVIITLPNNENRMYKVNESYRFMVSGQPASVHDLRRGMTIAAEKIVESPRTEIASDTVVTGKAPVVPVHAVAQTAAAPPVPAPVRRTEAPAVRQAPPPVAAQAAPEPEQPSEPRSLPTTEGQLPSVGLVGLCLIGGWLCLRKINRSQSGDKTTAIY